MCEEILAFILADGAFAVDRFYYHALLGRRWAAESEMVGGTSFCRLDPPGRRYLALGDRAVARRAGTDTA